MIRLEIEVQVVVLTASCGIYSFFPGAALWVRLLLYRYAFLDYS